MVTQKGNNLTPDLMNRGTLWVVETVTVQSGLWKIVFYSHLFACIFWHFWHLTSHSCLQNFELQNTLYDCLNTCTKNLCCIDTFWKDLPGRSYLVFRNICFYNSIILFCYYMCYKKSSHKFFELFSCLCQIVNFRRSGIEWIEIIHANHIIVGNFHMHMAFEILSPALAGFIFLLLVDTITV